MELTGIGQSREGWNVHLLLIAPQAQKAELLRLRLSLLSPDLLTGGIGAVGGPWAGQQKGDCFEPGGVGPMGEELTTELGSVLRKHAKNVAGSGPAGQDHKEAFVLGGVQGVDGQNGRGGGNTPYG